MFLRTRVKIHWPHSKNVQNSGNMQMLLFALWTENGVLWADSKIVFCYLPTPLGIWTQSIDTFLSRKTLIENPRKLSFNVCT